MTTPKAPPSADAAAPAEPTAPPETPAKNVVEALQRVQRDLPAIAKSDTSEQGYKYRGIESITAHAQQLFGRHGVVFVPRVLVREIVELQINSRPWTETRMQIEYDVFGPGGPDDRIVVGPLWAFGRDNSDKGANKCMTQAFKYALIQTLCIGDKADDVDAGEANVADARQQPPLDTDKAPRDLVDRIIARVREVKAAGVDVDARGWRVLGVQLVVDRTIVVDTVTAEGVLEQLEAIELPEPPEPEPEALPLCHVCGAQGVIADGTGALCDEHRPPPDDESGSTES